MAGEQELDGQETASRGMTIASTNVDMSVLIPLMKTVWTIELELWPESLSR